MGLFDKPVSNEGEVNLRKQLVEAKHQSELEISTLKHDHQFALKEKEFELKHFKDEEVQTLQKQLQDERQANAVLKKENEMLDKITNLNADIIDIKDLVANLIGKLPEIKLNNLTLSNGNNANSDK